MLDFLKEAGWQFGIATSVTALGVLVALFNFMLQRQRKQLTYYIVSNTPLLSLGDDLKGKIQISIGGQAVQEVQLVVIELANSGNQPIVPSDYASPVTVRFGPKAVILSAEVTETKPQNPQATVSIQGSAVEFAPVLLNRGDIVTAKVLATQLGEALSVDGHVAGVSTIQEYYGVASSNEVVIALSIFVGLLCVGLFILSLLTRSAEFLTVGTLCAGMLMGLVYGHSISRSGFSVWVRRR
ncbi:MAG: hypothetical protein ACR2M0_10990 [Chloroflexia bacterium]